VLQSPLFRVPYIASLANATNLVYSFTPVVQPQTNRIW